MLKRMFSLFIWLSFLCETLFGYSATLVHEYRMDESGWSGSASELVDSVGGKHGSSVANSLYTLSGVDYPPMPSANIASSFAGNGGLCRVGSLDNNGFDISNLSVSSVAGDFTTVAFWVRWDGSDGVIAFGFDRHDLIFLNHFFGFNTAGGDVTGIDAPDVDFKDKWRHVVAVFKNGDMSGNKLYIDGVKQVISLKQNIPNNVLAVAASNARIGGWRYVAQNTWYMFRGNIDEVSIWNGEFSDTDASTLYQNQKDGKNIDGSIRTCPAMSVDLSSKLKLDYRMDDAAWSGVANEVKDSSSSLYHGKGISGSSVNTTGKICKSGSFDGVGGYVDTGHSFSWGRNDKFSMSVWIKPDSIASLAPIISKGADWEYTLMLIDGGKIAFNYWGGPGNDELGVITSSATVNTGWNHIVFTYDGAYTDVAPADNKNIIRRAKIYINGKNIEIRKMGGLADGNNFKAAATNTTIGYGYIWPYKHYKGVIDEVKIFDGQALSYDEVSKLYEYESNGKNTNGVDRPCSPVGTALAAGFNCVDKDGLWDSGTIKTKSSDTGFNLDVVALKDDNADGLGEGEDNSYSGNITVSLGYATDTACSGWIPFVSGASQAMSGARKTVSLSALNKVSKELRCKVSDGTKTACSTDKFAVKPSGYEFDNADIKAEDFSLTVKAKNGGGVYDGTASLSTALAVANTACDKQSGFLAKKSGGGEPISLTFASDVSTNDLSALDVGAVTVTVKDSTWTAVDQPNDCGDSCDIKSDVNITIKPYSVKISDADMSEWGYKSKDSSYKTKFSAKSSAISKQGIVLKNFSKDCYADDVNVALKASTNGDLGDLNVTYSSAYTKATKKTYGYDFVIPKTDFSKGAKDFDLYLAWQKDNTKESNPQELNIATLTPSIGSASYDAYNADKNTMFLYGKFIFPSTVADFASTINVKGYKAFYSGADAVSVGGTAMSRVPGLKNWWINQKDITTSAIKAVISSPSDTLKDDNTTSKLGLASLISGAVGGEVVVSLSDVGNKTQKAILHFAVDDWLWASAFDYGYSFAVGSDCAAHPCGYLDIFDTNTNAGWSGSDKNTVQAIPKSKRKSRIEW